MKAIKIGKISGAQGLRGEVKMYHDSGDNEALERLSSIFIPENGKPGEDGLKKIRIESLRMHNRTPILRLEGVSDRNMAEALVGTEVYVDESEARPDEDDAFLASDLVGFEVYLKNNSEIGTIKSIISNPAHDILEIETNRGTLLLPFVDVFVIKVDIKSSKIFIDPPENW